MVEAVCCHPFMPAHSGAGGQMVGSMPPRLHSAAGRVDVLPGAAPLKTTADDRSTPWELVAVDEA